MTTPEPILLDVGADDAKPHADCCCIWERPPREARNRERRLVRLSTGCTPHAAAVRRAQRAAGK